MSTCSRSTREQLCEKLEQLFLHFQNHTTTCFDRGVLKEQDVDCLYASDLLKATNSGGIYFRPLSQERIAGRVQRPDMTKIDFFHSDGHPSDSNASMIELTLNEQLRRSKDRETSPALSFSHWKGVG
jgi:hypothetical protein